MVFAVLFTLLVGLLCVAVVLMMFSGRVSATWLLIIPGLFAWFVFGFAICTISAVLNTWVRDFQHLQAVGVQALFYATPVMFPAALLVQHKLGWLLTFNPLYHLMMIVRVPMLNNDVPELSHYVASVICIVFFLVVAVVSMRWARDRLVFWL